MRLQEVLKEREAEIQTLELSLKEKHTLPPAVPEKTPVPNGHVPNQSELSPQILDQIAAIRRSMEIRHPPSDIPVGDEDEPLVRLNDLMLYVLDACFRDEYCTDGTCCQFHGSEGSTTP